MTPSPISRYIRTKIAAGYTGLSPRTLENLRLKGTGPSYSKVGRIVLYDRHELDRWLAALVEFPVSVGAQSLPSSRESRHMLRNAVRELQRLNDSETMVRVKVRGSREIL